MSADHVALLVVALVAGWAVFRWGALILMAYAVWYLCTGQWFFAGFCFVLAGVIEAIKAPAMLLKRRAGYRGPWV